MNILISDLNIKLNGHKHGYIQNLIDYIKGLKTENIYIVFTNFSKDFCFDNYHLKNIILVSTTEKEETRLADCSNLFFKMKAQWKLILEQSVIHKIDHLLLMELDLYQFEIGIKQTNFTISGIWFRPYGRMQANLNSFIEKLKIFKQKIIKKLSIQWANRNSNLKKIFILNDESMPTWLNKSERKYYFLPDPCFQYPLLANFNLREKYDIPPENLILLQFGFIDCRKNTINFINALNQIEASNITLLVCGIIQEGYSYVLMNHKDNNSNYQLIIKDAFLPNDEMESTFAQSDVILRTNVGFFASSGVVGIAATHNKPCIVSNFGVMAEQIEKYGLGDVVDPMDISALKTLILKYLNHPEKRCLDGSKYRESHTLESFASTLLNLS